MKGLRLLFYLQANKLACHTFIYVYHDIYFYLNLYQSNRSIYIYVTICTYIHIHRKKMRLLCQRQRPFIALSKSSVMFGQYCPQSYAVRAKWGLLIQWGALLGFPQLGNSDFASEGYWWPAYHLLRKEKKPNCNLEFKLLFFGYRKKRSLSFPPWSITREGDVAKFQYPRMSPYTNILFIMILSVFLIEI